MATHRMQLGASAEKAQVGNAMSTSYSWDSETREFVIFWKYEKPVTVKIPSGIKYVQVRCGGGIPSVIPMQMPKNKVAQVAWENGFYGGMRIPKKEEIDILKNSFEASYFSNSARRDGHEYKQYRVQGPGYCFVYKPGNAMGGKSPYRWWADGSANWAEIQVGFWNIENNWPEWVEKFFRKQCPMLDDCDPDLRRSIFSFAEMQNGKKEYDSKKKEFLHLWRNNSFSEYILTEKMESIIGQPCTETGAGYATSSIFVDLKDWILVGIRERSGLEWHIPGAVR